MYPLPKGAFLRNRGRCCSFDFLCLQQLRDPTEVRLCSEPPKAGVPMQQHWPKPGSACKGEVQEAER